MTVVESSYVGLDPRSDLWGDPGWPEWVRGFRPHQEEAFAKIIGHFDSGADVVLLNAPTGSGKSILAEMTRRGLGALTTLYCPDTKDLQDQFCVSPETQILTADLRYVDAKTITVRQRLLGFDEHPTPNRRMWRTSIVEEVATIRRPGYRLWLEDGTVINCSSEHGWLTSAADGSNVKWMSTENLRVDGKGYNSSIIRLLDWWMTAKDRAAGYLAAAYDGEGHLGQREPSRGQGFDVNLVFSQNPNTMLERVARHLDEYGYVYRHYAGRIDGCHQLQIGSRADIIKFLGQIRPGRLLDKFDPSRLGMVNPVRPVKVVRREFLGEIDVVAIRTSTGTFVAHGLASHNCRDFGGPEVGGSPGGYAKLLKGRSNYPTLDNPLAFHDRWNPLSAADCAKKKELIPACSGCNHVSEAPQLHCRLCHEWFRCPYEVAKRAAMSAELAVLNTSYFLAEANGPGMFSKRDFVIIDEADTLEAALMNQVEVLITERRRIELDIPFPLLKTVSASWVEWVNMEAIPKVGSALAMINPDTSETDELRQIKYLSSLSGKLMKLREALEEGNAVYDGYQKGEIKFQPVNVAPFAKDMVWKHAERFLLMSATIIDPQEFVESLGIERAGMRWELVNVPSVFPAERRPIHVKHAANMVFKETDTAWPKMAAMVKRVLEEKHPNDRVLVHTVSYKFSQYLFDALRTSGREILVYSSAKERAGSLDMFKKIPNAVLLAPSMDRGIDLPGDLCRAVIVTKMPYANTKDKRVEARTYGTRNGRQWYNVQTIRKLIQMTGRGMRSEDDFCDVWILDEQFTTRVFKQNKGLFPKWWSEALDWSGGGL